MIRELFSKGVFSEIVVVPTLLTHTGKQHSQVENLPALLYCVMNPAGLYSEWAPFVLCLPVTLSHSFILYRMLLEMAKPEETPGGE